MTSGDLLVTAARLLGVEGPQPVIDGGWMLVRDGRIEGIGAGAAPTVGGARVLDVDGAFVAPGFVSAHSHLFTSASRGIAASESLETWTAHLCRTTMSVDAEAIYWLTMHGATDFLAHGITTAFDFSDASERHVVDANGQFTGASDLRSVDYQLRQVDAKVDSGIRFVNSVFLDDAFGTDEEIVDRFGAVARYGASLASDRYLATALSGALQWSDRADCAALELAVMRRFGVKNQAHVLESTIDVEAQRAQLAPYFETAILGPDLLLAHFLHPTPAMVAAAAAAGCGVSWQPVANGRLASGVLDIVGLREQGVVVAMGMDDQACNDSADPWQNMRTGLFTVRAATRDPRSITPAEALRMHTLGAAELIGAGDRVGSLAPGKLADFLVVDPRAPDIGPVRDAVGSYVLACGQRNLREVYVGGEVVARDGVAVNRLAREASVYIYDVLVPGADGEGAR